MPRPRSAHVETVRGECPVHGEVELRLSPAWRRADGSPGYRRRCPACHAETERARLATKREEGTA